MTGAMTSAVAPAAVRSPDDSPAMRPQFGDIEVIARNNSGRDGAQQT
jgi:hypothetical protein